MKANVAKLNSAKSGFHFLFLDKWNHCLKTDFVYILAMFVYYYIYMTEKIYH